MRAADLIVAAHPGIHATRDTIRQEPGGHVATRPPVCLQQEVVMYDAYLQRIAECDQALEQHLKGVADKVADTAPDGEPSPTASRVRSGPKRRRKASAMPRSLTWAVNYTASAAST
jgi:hypothetical protein